MSCEDIADGGWRPEDGDIGGVLIHKFSEGGTVREYARVELSLPGAPDQSVGLVAAHLTAGQRRGPGSRTRVVQGIGRYQVGAVDAETVQLHVVEVEEPNVGGEVDCTLYPPGKLSGIDDRSGRSRFVKGRLEQGSERGRSDVRVTNSVNRGEPSRAESGDEDGSIGMCRPDTTTQHRSSAQDSGPNPPEQC